MTLKLLNPASAPGGHHQLAVHEVWQAVSRLTAPGVGLGSPSAFRVWAALWLFRDPATGVADIARNDLATLAGISVQRTSRILTALETAGLIRRQRQPTPGTQGPGKVMIFVEIAKPTTK